MKLQSKNQKFILRPIKLSDLKGYWESMQDKKSRKGFMTTPKTINEAKKEIKEMINEARKKPVTGECFAIIVNGEYAGYVRISHLNRKYHKHKGEIGYCSHPKFRGKGLATKAVKILTNYAFKKHKLKRIEGICRTFNKSSTRVLEKAGFKLEGILRKNILKNKRYLDDMIWARVR